MIFPVTEQVYIPERRVESEDEDDYREQPKKARVGRPTGSTNKKSRKLRLVVDATINDGENESEINEIQDIDVEGESGCKSPVKKII